MCLVAIENEKLVYTGRKESDSIMIVSMSEKDNMLVVANYIALDAHDDGTIIFQTKIRNYIYE